MKKVIYSFSVLFVGILIGASLTYGLMEQYRQETIRANKAGEMSASLSAYMALSEMEPTKAKCVLSKWSHILANDLASIDLTKGALYEYFVPGEIPAEKYVKDSLSEFTANKPELCE